MADIFYIFPSEIHENLSTYSRAGNSNTKGAFVAR